MKKSMFLLGVAVAALASCTNEEVVSVPDSAAINFASFVNNTTKAVTEVDADDLSGGNYYVFGNFGTNQNSTTPGDWADQVFDNELSTVTYYWSVGNYYRFGAYANGVGGKLDATFNAATQTLTFPSYTPDDTKDLIAALGTGDASASVPGSPVSLDFDHMLSQVGFTFYTTDGTGYTIAITDLAVKNAVQTGATGTYTASGASWTGGTDADYEYDNIDNVYHVAAITNEDPQQFKLVIPQAVPVGADKIQVSFTATITGDGITTGNSNSFTIDLTSPDTEGWKPGYRYNYTAMVNGAVIAGLTPITFTASVTDDWKDANDTELTVTD